MILTTVLGLVIRQAYKKHQESTRKNNPVDIAKEPLLDKQIKKPKLVRSQSFSPTSSLNNKVIVKFSSAPQIHTHNNNDEDEITQSQPRNFSSASGYRSKLFSVKNGKAEQKQKISSSFIKTPVLINVSPL